LNEDEAELRRVLTKEKSIEREIKQLTESIGGREKSYRSLQNFRRANTRDSKT
jgi:hypothetical protein